MDPIEGLSRCLDIIPLSNPGSILIWTYYPDILAAIYMLSEWDWHANSKGIWHLIGAASREPRRPGMDCLVPGRPWDSRPTRHSGCPQHSYMSQGLHSWQPSYKLIWALLGGSIKISCLWALWYLKGIGAHSTYQLISNQPLSYHVPNKSPLHLPDQIRTHAHTLPAWECP